MNFTSYYVMLRNFKYIRVAAHLSVVTSSLISILFWIINYAFLLLQVRIAVFNQHHVDGLDLSSNPLLYMMRCYPVSSLYSVIITFFLNVLWELILNQMLDYRGSHPSNL